jgi:hypothetical protein
MGITRCGYPSTASRPVRPSRIPLQSSGTAQQGGQARDATLLRAASHCDWLDAQARVGIDDSRIARAAVTEFLYGIQEEEGQRWISDVRAELPARTSTIDVIVNAALSQGISRHHAEFYESP